MRVRKDERPIIEQILSKDGDLDEVVADVYSAVADLVIARDWYVVAAAFGPQIALYGPYSSTSEATKDMLRLVAPGPEVAVYSIRKMYKVGDVT